MVTSETIVQGPLQIRSPLGSNFDFIDGRSTTLGWSASEAAVIFDAKLTIIMQNSLVIILMLLKKNQLSGYGGRELHLTLGVINLRWKDLGMNFLMSWQRQFR